LSKRTLSILVGVLVSVGALYIVAQGLDFTKVAGALKSANYWWLIPNVVVILVTMLIRAVRWGSMVRPLKVVPFEKLLSATAVGFMANNVLPFRLGEFVRAYSLSSQDKEISKSASLAMIFTERVIFDLITLAGIFGLVLLTTELSVPTEVKQGSMLILLAASIGILFTFVMALWPTKVSSFIGKYLTVLPEKVRGIATEVITRFSLGLSFMRSPSAGAMVLAQTVVIWVALGLSNLFVFVAFDLNLPLEASFATLAVVSIWIMVPSTPGFVGVYHAAVVYTLAQYDVGKDEAVACALIMHAAQFTIVTLFGLYYLWKSHLTLKDVELVASGENA
jgi:uncharacterized protein (TIRG00374 family)